MTDGQGKDRRSVAGETPRSMRGAHLPQPGRRPARHFRAGCPSRVSLVRSFGLIFGFEPVGHDGPRDEARNARRPGCSGVRNGREAESPCGFICNGSVVPMSARPQGPLRPYGTGQSAAMELTRWRPDGNGDENCDGPAGCDSKGERARLLPPRWSYRGPDLLAVPEQVIAAYAAIIGETWKPLEASTALVAAAVPCPTRGDGRVPGGVTHHTGGGAIRGSVPAVVRHPTKSFVLCAFFRAGPPARRRNQLVTLSMIAASPISRTAPDPGRRAERLACDQAAIGSVISRSSWPISCRRRRMRGPYVASSRMAAAR